MLPFGDDLLAIYLQDHLAGATAGVELARRARGQNRGTALGRSLDRLVQEIEEDRDELEGIMRTLGVGADRVKVAAAWTGEKLGRLKLNGRITSYSPLSAVVELQALILGVTAKRALWLALRGLAEQDERLDPVRLDRLAGRAERQLDSLWQHHLDAALAALAE